jgi:hypothetical protein
MAFSRELVERELAAVVDAALAEQVCRAYVAMQQRYFAGDWGPAELDGGQFCEAAARAMYQLDTNCTTTDLPGKIAEYLLDKGKTPGPHNLDKKDRDHFCRVLQTTYKFRNDRGVAHISSKYTSNHADATLIVACVKWMFAEFLRLGWNSDRDQVGEVIEAIVQLEHPLIHELDGKPLVLTTKLSAPEEILVVLSRSEDARLTRDQIKACVKKSNSAVSTAISRLIVSREVRESEGKEIVLTSLGERRVREDILPKVDALPHTKNRTRSARTSHKRQDRAHK